MVYGLTVAELAWGHWAQSCCRSSGVRVNCGLAGLVSLACCRAVVYGLTVAELAWCTGRSLAVGAVV